MNATQDWPLRLAVDPAFARRGIGRSLLKAGEEAIQRAGFATADLVATLAGEPLYAVFGYAVVERYELALADGLRLPVVRMTKSLGDDSGRTQFVGPA